MNIQHVPLVSLECFVMSIHCQILHISGLRYKRNTTLSCSWILRPNSQVSYLLLTRYVYRLKAMDIHDQCVLKNSTHECLHLLTLH